MKRKIAVFLTALLAATSLVGCGSKVELTTREVLEGMRDAMADVTSVEAKMVLDIDMTVSAQGKDIPMNMDGEVDVAYLMESDGGFATSMSGYVEAKVMGEETRQNMKSRSFTEDGKTITYTYDNMSSSWESEYAESEENADQFEVDVEELLTFLTLKEEVKKYGGAECYVLTGKADPSVMGDLSGELLLVDSDGLEFKMSLYVNKDTFRPEGVTLEVPATKQEEDGVVIKISKMKMSIEIGKYDSLKDGDIENPYFEDYF